MVKHNVGIEIFPFEKSCAQGCSHCRMALKEDTNYETHINSYVDYNTHLFTKYLHKHNTVYDIHYSTLLNGGEKSFPKIYNTKLIDMMRFDTGREIRDKDGPKNLSLAVNRLLQAKNVDPLCIGFSIVPKTPLIDTDDIKIIGETIGEVASWFFKKPNRRIEVTIRSNLIPSMNFDLAYPKMEETDKKILIPFIRNLCADRSQISSVYNFNKKSNISKDPDLYFSEHKLSALGGDILITNRMIRHNKHTDLPQTHLEQARNSVGVMYHTMNFAIAPQGIMLNHSSLSINNPILWIRHEEFEHLLMKRSKKPGFEFGEFGSNIIFENYVMYEYFYKYEKEIFNNTKLDGWRDVFMVNRPTFVKLIEQANKN